MVVHSVTQTQDPGLRVLKWTLGRSFQRCYFAGVKSRTEGTLILAREKAPDGSPTPALQGPNNDLRKPLLPSERWGVLARMFQSCFH